MRSLACEQLLARRPDVTAVVAASDELALGVLQARGTSRAERCSVVGYDDSPIATIGDGLTTIRQPIPEIARRIIALASGLIDRRRPRADARACVP